MVLAASTIETQWRAKTGQEKRMAEVFFRDETLFYVVAGEPVMHVVHRCTKYIAAMATRRALFNLTSLHSSVEDSAVHDDVTNKMTLSSPRNKC